MESTIKEPLFHIAKRDGLPFWKGMLIRVVAILLSLALGAIIISASAPQNKGFFGVFSSLFSGNFGTERRIWNMLQEMSLLLGVSLALIVAFKMKFWNLGGNGQILMGCLACTMCMYYLGGKLPDGVVYIFMILSSVLAGALWALLPALGKVFFKTNESLFTLMMNYIAMNLVTFFISYWYPTGSGSMAPLEHAHLPVFGEGQMGKVLPVVLVVALITAAIFVYLKFSKHGYELSVVGESENTARYAGINVKAVVIRTMVLSGAICGVIGLLLSGSINHMISANMDGNMGFTGIMAAWLGKFDSLVVILTSFFITFISRGMNQVRTDFGFSSSALSDVIIGIIYFFVIACEFLISYKIIPCDKIKEKFKRKPKVAAMDINGGNAVEITEEDLQNNPKNANEEDK